jgi:hypothetical protein
VRDDVEAFFSELHARLKPLGFRRTRHRFARAREGYVEHILFEGSSWNSADGPWRFHLDLAVELPDLPAKSVGWGRANARGRVRHLVADAPDHFDLDASTRDDLLALLPALVARAVAALPSVVPAARTWAERGRLASLHALVSGLPPPPAGV